MTTPSGLFNDILIPSGLPFFGVYTDSVLITTISGPYASNAKIFESPSDLFIHRLGAILVWDNDVTFTRTGVDCATMCETSQNQIITVASNTWSRNSVIRTGLHGDGVISGWLDSGTLTGFTAKDSVSDNTYFRPVPTLIGNMQVTTLPRMVRNDLKVRPFGDFPKSDDGITQITPNIAQITDIEAV